MSIANITPLQLGELVTSGKSVTLIDVRTPAEYRECHVAMARNIPMDKLDPDEFKNHRGNGEALYIICRSGGRGQKACKKLCDAGIARVFNIEGGTVACEQAGLPMTHGKKAIGLERQVRIAAGSLVLLGSMLSALVHPYFIGLTAFIGAGLVFAGISDWCGMGLLLARMPWNRTSAEHCQVNP